MKYKSVVVTQFGGPEVLQVIEHELREPLAREVRIRVLAASVSRVDITARVGEALYHGTPLGQKIPFTPGYAIVGIVDRVGKEVNEVAVGDRVGALTVVGGYSETIYWKSDRLFPVPSTLDPAEAVVLILNYMVAYQSLHRYARVKSGDTVLLIGASGGIGTALLQLGKLAHLKMYGIASRRKHAVLEEYGALPIDHQTQDYRAVILQAEPDGLHAVINGMMSTDYIHGGYSLLRRGGRLVCFGEPDGFSVLFRVLGATLAANLLPNGKTIHLYGTSFYFVGDKKPFLEDWAALFKMLEAGQIKPVIEQRFPILEAAGANARLETGQVVGNLVLVTPELL